MKTKLLLTIAVAGLLTLASRAYADDIFMPKAKAQADSLARSGEVALDLIDRSAPSGSPKHVAMTASLHRETGTTQDMIARTTPSASPKALSNEPWRVEQYQVAPVK